MSEDVLFARVDESDSLDMAQAEEAVNTSKYLIFKIGRAHV